MIPGTQLTSLERARVASSVYSRTLQKAAELIGGRKNVCRHLRVPAAELDKWIDDKAVPPIGVFLRVVDFIIDETPPPAESSDPGDAPPSRDCSSAGDSSATPVAATIRTPEPKTSRI
jgi:hypothetical protein